VGKCAIDAGTLASVQALYKPGVRVKVVKVGGLRPGMTGAVKKVRENGNIVVLWDSGYETDVIFGSESVSVIVEGFCILSRNPDYPACAKDNCAYCGWNTKVAAKRSKMIQAGAMTRGKDGLLCLKVKTHF